MTCHQIGGQPWTGQYRPPGFRQGFLHGALGNMHGLIKLPNTGLKLMFGKDEGKLGGSGGKEESFFQGGDVEQMDADFLAVSILRNKNN